MFDAHAHLKAAPPPDGPVTGWVVPGVDLESEELARRLLAQDPRLVAALGLHPWYLPAELDEALEQLDALASTRRPVAIGETGLDSGQRGSPRPLQRRAFLHQIRLAKRLELPLILHVVRQHGACLERLRQEGFRTERPGMVHDFQGPLETVSPWSRAGFYLSISPRGQDREPIIAAIPDDRLLVETDDAGPAALPGVIEHVARARGVEPQRIAELTEANTRRLFDLATPGV